MKFSDQYQKDKAELEEILRLSDSGLLKYYTIDEAERMADEVLKK
ncbi:hypothetical protein [Flavobacterium akiainvivens]|nr:hypothetical protein [Flavobacterium akiainvivens]